MRACLGSLNPNDCGSQREAYEIGSCNSDWCPWWGRWGGWSDCSANCGGGIRDRTRSCVNRFDEVQPDEDCAGSENDEELCNQTSCEREIIYWNNQLSHGNWILVSDQLPDGDSMLDQCSSYCLALDGCLGMAVSRFQVNPFEIDSIRYSCYINHTPYTRGPECWGSLCTSELNFQSIVFGVFKDYYEENPQFLPTDNPDGELEVNLNDIDGLCNGIQVVSNNPGAAFGLVTYKETDGVAFETEDDKNVLIEDGTAECGARCFMKAGCKAFYINDNNDTCRMIFNTPTGSTEMGGIGEGGMLTDLCYNPAFNDQVTRQSRFNCLFFAPDDPDIVDEILARNGVGPNALNTWTYEVLNAGNPYVVRSRYVTIDFTDNDGTDERYRAVYFNIETHIRVGRYDWVFGSENMTGRKRRESVRVGELTEADDMKNHKQAAKAAKKQRNDEKPVYPLGTILNVAKEVEKAATDAILNGGLILPEGVSVVATTPIELVEFVQRTDDGSIAADCSSGDSCTCGRGFIDNGEGCVEMTEEQAATTEAPTTQTVPTTSYSNVVEYLPSLVVKMDEVFQKNRPGPGRSHLSRKWTNLSQKFLNRYNNLVERGCDFSMGLENTVDFDTVNTCRVSSFQCYYQVHLNEF